MSTINNITFEQVKAAWMHSQQARTPGSLATPHHAFWSQILTEGATSLLVSDVKADSVDDVRILHDWVVAPARSHGVALTLHPGLDLDRDPQQFSEDRYGYPHTWQKLLHKLEHEPVRLTPGNDDHLRRLDPHQRAAAAAPPGVLQIIAPAGSGKTTVLVARVAHLLSSGADPRSVLCVTFNKDARAEMRRRLRDADLHGIHVHTYHSLAMSLLSESGVLREGGIETTSMQTWRMLAMKAKDAAGERGTYIEPADAQAAISDFKLNARITPQEAAERAPDDDIAITLAELYRVYEERLRERDAQDFDDMLLELHRLLRDDPHWRTTFQTRFEHILVDEYQDTEPIQDDLITVLAAPHDNLLVVGDEDQCHVTGTMISTGHGLVPIEQLDPDRHEILGGDPDDGELRPSPFARSARYYTGPLVTIEAGGTRSTCTAEHIWITRGPDRGRRLAFALEIQPGDEIPVHHPDSGELEWRPVTDLRIRHVEDEIVHSISAPAHETYIANGMLTHNCLYAWRRASVTRSLEFDLQYPWVNRVALQTNYRCPRRAVEASRQIIARNRQRFRKPIYAPSDKPAGDDDVMLLVYDEPAESADVIARRLARSTRGDIAVIARTTRSLRVVAEACVPHGVALNAPKAVFEPSGARRAIEAYLNLIAHPETATDADILDVLRAPNRALPYGAEPLIREELERGATFTDAFARVADERSAPRLRDAADILLAAARQADAAAAIGVLRTRGGLDRHFQEIEEVFGKTEKVEIDTLTLLQDSGRGKTIRDLAAELRRSSQALLALNRPDDGIELTTIHRAKGREWPIVVWYGVDEDESPHRSAIEEDRRDGVWDGLEGERRVAYVAATRAKEKLVIVSHRGRQSRFLTDAKLTEHAGKSSGRAVQLGPNTETVIRGGSTTDALMALRGMLSAEELCGMARSTTDALRFLATVVGDNDGDSRTCVDACTIGELLTACPGFTRRHLEAIGHALPVRVERRVGSLDPSARAAVAELCTAIADRRRT